MLDDSTNKDIKLADFSLQSGESPSLPMLRDFGSKFVLKKLKPLIGTEEEYVSNIPYIGM